LIDDGGGDGAADGGSGAAGGAASFAEALRGGAFGVTALDAKLPDGRSSPVPVLLLTERGGAARGNAVGVVRKGVLEMDAVAARAFKNGEDMRLKPKEFALLLLMAQNEDAVMSAEFLYKALWNMPLAGSSQAVRTVVSRVRAKLFGAGYTIVFRRDEKGYCFQSEKK
jgi:hypothetical protein